MDTAYLVAHEARDACKGEPDILERVRKAMRASRHHWGVTNPEDQFRGAVAGAMLESEEAERDRIERSMKALSRIAALLQAMQAGVPVDLEAMAAEKQDDDLIPLRKLWDETEET